MGLENIESGTRQYVVAEEAMETGQSACWHLGPQHVLYGKLRPYLNKVFLPEKEGRCSLEILPLLPREGFSRDLIAAVLQSPVVVQFTSQHSTGGRMPRADIRKLLAFQVPMPESVTECNKVGTELSRRLATCLNMRRAAERQFEASSALPVAELRSVFSLQELPAGWIRRPISDLVRADGQQIDSREADFSTLPFLGLENIESGTGRFVIPEDQAEPGRSACFRFGPQHVLYGKLRPYLNKVLLPQSNGRCALEILPLLPTEGFSREFVAAVLRSPLVVTYATHHSTGGRMPRADIRKLMRFEVPIPETRDACNQLGAQLTLRLNNCSVVHSAAARQLETVSAMPAATLRKFFNFENGVHA